LTLVDYLKPRKLKAPVFAARGGQKTRGEKSPPKQVILITTNGILFQLTKPLPAWPFGKDRGSFNQVNPHRISIVRFYSSVL
jgi:hypothetical protein